MIPFWAIKLSFAALTGAVLRYIKLRVVPDRDFQEADATILEYRSLGGALRLSLAMFRKPVTCRRKIQHYVENALSP
ncbi:hypothetical protein [Rhodopseudomonas palustris]|uniref:hypothetical protein n=1 Tax=Rhodopseudomonas palustris TaxID=1076 RepID=UPI000D1BD03D|nr:hypothetical protein [Rhodopseudomonas palustris]